MDIENWMLNKKQEVAMSLGLKAEKISIQPWQGFDWKGSDKSRPRGSWHFVEIARQAPDGQIYAVYACNRQGAIKVALATGVILLCFILLVICVTFLHKGRSHIVPEHITSPITS